MLLCVAASVSLAVCVEKDFSVKLSSTNCFVPRYNLSDQVPK